jgi:uncharacterized MAPEG superfamily protein
MRKLFCLEVLMACIFAAQLLFLFLFLFLAAKEQPHQTACPKDFSMALRGCEQIAMDINSQLTECYQKYARCANMYLECKGVDAKE